MIITYFGDGKGKTTAALGLALRASGYDKKIKIIQFVKGNWKSGEQQALKKLPNVKLEKFGLGFIGLDRDKYTLLQHTEAAKRGLKQAQCDVSSGTYQIIILDEILGASKAGLLSTSEICDLILVMPKQSTLVLTGRPRIEKIIELSDLVSEIKKIKHPFDLGIKAVESIDY